jgi:hypothetical protein
MRIGPFLREHRVWLWPVGALLFVTVFLWLRPKPAPIADRERTTIDSLMATKPAFDSQRVERIRAETVYVTRAAISRAAALQSIQSADSLRERAIVAQRVAEARGDTASQWRTVADLRTAESDSLRSANGALATALSDMNLARSAAVSRATAAEARLSASENLNSRLADDVRAGDRCRVLLVISCPSRRVAAAGGVIVGAAVVALIDRRP